MRAAGAVAVSREPSAGGSWPLRSRDRRGLGQGRSHNGAGSRGAGRCRPSTTGGSQALAGRTLRPFRHRKPTAAGQHTKDFQGNVLE